MGSGICMRIASTTALVFSTVTTFYSALCLHMRCLTTALVFSTVTIKILPLFIFYLDTLSGVSPMDGLT